MAQAYWQPNGYPQSQQTWNPPPNNPQQAPPTWQASNPPPPGPYSQPNQQYAYAPPPSYPPQGGYPPQQPPPTQPQQYYQYQQTAPPPPNNQYQQPTQAPVGPYQLAFAPPPVPQQPPPGPPTSAFPLPPAPQQPPTFFSQPAHYHQIPQQTAPTQQPPTGQYPQSNPSLWSPQTPVSQPTQPSYPFPNFNNSGPQKNSYGEYAGLSTTSTVMVSNAGNPPTGYTSTAAGPSGRARPSNAAAPYPDRRRKPSSSQAAPVKNSNHWQCCDCDYAVVSGYKNEITHKYEHCRFDNGFTTHKRCRRCRDEFGVSYGGE